jgi:hypothetical protein
MKKVFAALLAALILLTSTPSAQAGALLEKTVAGKIFIGIGVVFIAGSTIAEAEEAINNWPFWVGVAFFILDTPTTSGFAEVLKTKYPFIDNQESLLQIANLMVKAAETASTLPNGSRYFETPRKDLSVILDGLAISPAQYDLILSELATQN